MTRIQMRLLPVCACLTENNIWNRMKRKDKQAKRPQAFLPARIEVQKQTSAQDGTWHELVALGWDGHSALLASFRRKSAAMRCKALLLSALRRSVKEAAHPDRPARSLRRGKP